ncbi:hypothetical protein KCU93_g482, partial [Aureobasidium melanogenum]
MLDWQCEERKDVQSCRVECPRGVLTVLSHWRKKRPRLCSPNVCQTRMHDGCVPEARGVGSQKNTAALCRSTRCFVVGEMEILESTRVAGNRAHRSESASHVSAATGCSSNNVYNDCTAVFRSPIRRS